MKRLIKQRLYVSLISIILYFFCISLVLGQSPNVRWVNGIYTNDLDPRNDITFDPSGNIIISGCYQGTAVFDLGGPNETSLTCLGHKDMYLAKYDADGALMWATKAGGSGWAWCWGFNVTTDLEGNIIVTGRYDGLIIFGAGETNETVLTPISGWELYVAKYDPDGNLLWAKSAPGVCNDIGLSGTTDADGNVIVTGSIECSATFGSGSPNQTTISSAGLSDFILAKYDADGNFLWVKRAGSSSWEQGVGIEADDSNNYYVAAYFEGTVVFGAGEPNETTLSSHGGADVVIAKFDESGNLIWAKSGGGSGTDLSEAIAIDASGNSYLTGLFYNTVIFGVGEANETELTSFGDEDIFIAKYNPQGELIWAHKAGGNSYDRPYSISMLGQTQFVITGEFSGVANFGAYSLTSSGAQDAFVAAYDASGNVLWAKKFGGAAKDIGNGIDCANLARICVGGFFTGVAVFDDFTLNATSQPGDFVAYLAFSLTEQIAFLGDEIDQLVERGVLTEKQADQLQKKLDKASKKLDRGKVKKAIKSLNQMIKKINKWIKKGKIPQEDGEFLIAEITAIIDQLGDSLGKRLSEQLNYASNLPEDFQLEQNFPNPFNSTTFIKFAIPESQSGELDVQLNIYNVHGQVVRHLVNDHKSAGFYQIQWDGTDDFGEFVSSGIYFYSLKAGSFVMHRKLLFVK
ncbi:MAG: T9SS type A sorting domain-containing protein [Calditrichaeota bacterium]|nr:T9SS type A sorting domain-containing protein [Calditrichota bacterium]